MTSLQSALVRLDDVDPSLLSTALQTQTDLNRKAIRLVGMGSWRLKGFVSETLQLLVANLEGAWRHLIDDLGLYPIKPVNVSN